MYHVHYIAQRVLILPMTYSEEKHLQDWIDIHKKLQQLAKESDRSVGRQIAHMIKIHEQKKVA